MPILDEDFERETAADHAAPIDDGGRRSDEEPPWVPWAVKIYVQLSNGQLRFREDGNNDRSHTTCDAEGNMDIFLPDIVGGAQEIALIAEDEDLHFLEFCAKPRVTNTDHHCVTEGGVQNTPFLIKVFPDAAQSTIVLISLHEDKQSFGKFSYTLRYEGPDGIYSTDDPEIHNQGGTGGLPEEECPEGED